MDVGSLLPPLYEDLEFLSPLSAARADELVDFVAGVPQGGRVLDLGCGWGELLLRVLAAAPHARGLGVDRNEQHIARAAAMAQARGLAERVDLVAADASSPPASRPDAVICIGASQIWGTEEAVDLDYEAALNALRELVDPGARVLYGEAVWGRPPTPAAMAALGGSATEFLPVADLALLADRLGFSVRRIAEATLDEWDAFESGYCWNMERALLALPAPSPHYDEVRQLLTTHRGRWLNGYRGVLGMAYLCLVAR